MTQRAFASSAAPRRLVVLAAALAVACSGGGSDAKVGNPLSVCVLQGTIVSEGCFMGADGTPRIELGSMTMGEQKTRVTTVQTAGSTPVDINEVALQGSSLTNYSLQLYTLVDGVETPVTLPVKLVKSGGVTELRARVRFLADQGPGAIGGVALHIVSPQVEMTIPITGEVADCPGGFGDCDGNHLNGCEAVLTEDLNNCGSCANSCLGKANVDYSTNSGAVCDLGICKVTLCQATWFDQNSSSGDGCECQKDDLADSCATATWAGNVAAGQSTAMAGNIVPIDDADYILISWQSLEDWQAFHPRIELVDDSGVLAFDLTVNCGAAVSCNLDTERAANPAAVGLRSWETYCFPGQAGCNYILARAASATSPVGEFTVVRVYSTATTANQTCLPYTLNISNAVTPAP